MARSEKRSSSSTPISKSAIEQASSTLQELPEKPRDNWSLREAVALLQEPISTALERGYSYEEIAKMLAAAGVEISASSLKSYLSAAKRQKGGATSSKKRRVGRRSKNTPDQATILEAAHALSEATHDAKGEHASLNGVAPSDAEELSDAEEEPAGRTTRRRTRTSSTRSGSAARAKTAAKSKPAASTRSKSATSAKSSRRRRSQADED